MFDGFAVLEVPLYHLGHILLCDAEVPGTPWVDDQVRAMFTEAQAPYGVNANVPDHALRTQLVLEGLAHGFGPTLFAVSTLADEHVGVVDSDLRGRLCERRRRATLLRFFLRLLASLRDGFLPFCAVRSTTLVGGSNISPEPVGRYHGRYEISRRIIGADGLSVARAGVGDGALLEEGAEI